MGQRTVATGPIPGPAPCPAVATPAWVANPSLAESRAYCEYLTRTQARNFYYGLKLLPESKRSAMFAL